MVKEIRNIYCVGRNYRRHAEELGNAVPDEPMIFMKPTHALVPMDGRELVLPSGRGEIHFETELVLRMGKSRLSDTSAIDRIDAIAFGLDLTLRDVQSVLKKNGHPWLAAKGFVHSAPISVFQPFPGTKSLMEHSFTMTLNGKQMQRGILSQMIFPPETLIAFIDERFGLGEGDLIFTGTPAGVGPLTDGDHVEIRWGQESVGSITVQIR